MEMRKREGTLSLEEEAAVEQGIKLIESGKFPKVPHPVMKLYYFLIARPRRAIFYPSTIPITSKRRNLAGFGESMVTATHVARGDLFEVHSQVTGEVGTLMLVRRRRIWMWIANKSNSTLAPRFVTPRGGLNDQLSGIAGLHSSTATLETTVWRHRECEWWRDSRHHGNSCTKTCNTSARSPTPKTEEGSNSANQETQTSQTYAVNWSELIINLSNNNWDAP